MTDGQQSTRLGHCLLAGAITLLLPSGVAAEPCTDPVDLSTRPSPAPVRVDLTLQVKELRDINEGDSTFTADFETIMTWRDERLDQAMAGSGPACPYDLDTIWSPATQITNFVAVLDESVAFREVSADGQVVEWRRYLATMTAEFDTAQFPFDEQTLQFDLQLLRERPEDVSLNLVVEPGSFSTEAAGWNVGAMPSEAAPRRFGARKGAPEVAGMTIELPIQRQWFGPFINIYLPNLGCTLVALSVYFLPSDDGGNRIALSSTSMLIAAAFAFVMSNYITGSLAPIDLFFWASVILPFVAFGAALLSIPLVARERDWVVLRMDQILLLVSSTAFLWLTVYVWFPR
jgi:hypothetical protein